MSRASAGGVIEGRRRAIIERYVAPEPHQRFALRDLLGVFADQWAQLGWHGIEVSEKLGDAGMLAEQAAGGLGTEPPDLRDVVGAVADQRDVSW